MQIQAEAAAFAARKLQELVEARQRAALQLSGGLDLGRVLESTGSDRLTLIRRLRRLIERERLRGTAAHWSYDLNRHIALKQALDRLVPSAEEPRLLT